jgi:hypothetical protein
VEFETLILMIGAACLGAWLGAGIVAGFSRRKVQIGMGTALLFASLIVIAQLLNLAPGGEALSLSGTRLILGVTGNFVLGALMTLGVGLYAPCMVLVSILGMNPTAAFPIMMGSCAFLMPVASIQFVRRNAYNLRAAIGLALGGPLAVLLAIWHHDGARTRPHRHPLHLDLDAPVRGSREESCNRTRPAHTAGIAQVSGIRYQVSGRFSGQVQVAFRLHAT